MANPQKNQGYVGVANEIWDEVIRRDFTKRQKDILLFILRLSYGCNRKTAHVPKQQDFLLCGLGGKGHVSTELTLLERCKVITRVKESNEYGINKDYEKWQVSPVRGWDDERFKELVHINLMEKKKEQKKVPITGTTHVDEGSQNGNSEELDEFPKQEPQIPKTGTSDEKKFPKQEQEVPETGTLTPDEPLQDAASEASKKGLNHKVIKDSLKQPKKNSSRPKKYSEDSSPYKMAVYLHGEIMNYAESISKAHLVRNADMQKWAETCRLILEVDKRPAREVFEIIQWATKDDFWQKNMLSPSSLRRNYVKLAFESSSKRAKGKKGSQSDALFEKNQKEKEKIKEMLANEGSGNSAIISDTPKHLQFLL